MSLTTQQWRYVGAQSFASATVAAVLDAAFTLGTKTTYASGSARVEGSGSAWTWTGRRYQNAGTTEATYPLPPTNTMNARYCLAGAASLPTPNPTMAFSDVAAANILMFSMAKNGGAFATWNAASPFTSGDNSNYVRCWPTTAGTGNVYLWESQEQMILLVSTASGGVYAIWCGAGDPETASPASAESDGRVYGFAVSGSVAALSTTWWTASTTSGWFDHVTTGAANHCAVFTPGQSALLGCELATRPRTAPSASGLKNRDNEYARIPMGLRFVAAAPNDQFACRLREIFMFTDAVTPQSQANIVYVVSASTSTAADAIALGH